MINKLLFLAIFLLLPTWSFVALSRAAIKSKCTSCFSELLNLPVYSLTSNPQTFSEKTDENLLYASEQFTISNIYPNPASEVASFNYAFYDFQTSAKIVIRNVLGSIVGEYLLSPTERQITLSLERWAPGVYFYTLWINNKSVVTKKLVIKR
ncbi:MAG: T9SS type A sorting domain-containing protein [Cytophagales bacterium]|nr:T9SS type A sorting domain-containing protein [Bernardetiaceae bacterium]MDW8209443.1 T9SS type A sorting domain-containing protein [Cytophagales bacterium]